jgi:phosphate transport system permease protein
VTTSPPETAAGPSPQRRTFPHAHSLAQRIREAIIEFSLLCCGLVSIAVTVTIAGIILYWTIQFFRDPSVSFVEFVTGTEWTAGFANPRFGILSMLTGTLMVALIAGAIALPIGLATAIFLSEYATPRIRSIAKPALEILAGIPTVVYGYFALITITPFLNAIVPGGVKEFNQLAGGIIVGIMILPMVASLSEDAIRSVPRSLREASYALGADQYDTSVRVIVPAALSGILASFVLAISRAVGETMAVTLACGTEPRFSLDPRQGVATMTSFIVGVALGDEERGTTTYNSLFAVAAVLFVLTLSMNILSQWVLRRYRQVYQ